VYSLIPMILLPSVMLVSSLLFQPLNRMYDARQKKKITIQNQQKEQEWINAYHMYYDSFASAYRKYMDMYFPSCSLLKYKIETKEDRYLHSIHDGIQLRFFDTKDVIHQNVDEKLKQTNDENLYPKINSFHTYHKIAIKDEGEMYLKYIFLQFIYLYDCPCIVYADAFWLKKHQWVRLVPNCLYHNQRMITSSFKEAKEFSECLKDKKKEAANFRHIEEESNKYTASRILQKSGKLTVVVNPPYPPLTEAELDRSFDLPYTRLPHPKYKGKRIPAYDMIKFSVNLHRGCFGGCAFCTISAHQGKFIVSRSKESILKEVKAITELPDFKGYLSDLGGPSANMYRMKGRDEAVCRKCKRPSCIYPKVCPNLNTDHRPLLDIYHAVDALPGIKKSFIGSGVRYDLLLHQSKDPNTNKSTQEYTRELIARHVSGRLKVAPEHTSDRVLNIMRKPPFSQFGEFKKIFDRINHEEGLRQQLIPYFISSHPGCKEEDMAELAVITKRLDFHLEQVQDFTPTPMTVATEAWYTGFHPYTLEPVFSAKTQREKLAQRQFFFWYKPEERRNIINELRRIGRTDLIDKLYGKR